jgi:hypothetical protein
MAIDQADDGWTEEERGERVPATPRRKTPRRKVQRQGDDDEMSLEYL